MNTRGLCTSAIPYHILDPELSFSTRERIGSIAQYPDWQMHWDGASAAWGSSHEDDDGMRQELASETANTHVQSNLSFAFLGFLVLLDAGHE